MEVLIQKHMLEELPYWSIRAVNNKMTIFFYYTEARILASVFQFKNRRLVNYEYHYNENGTFNTCINRSRRYILRRDDVDVIRLDFT